MDWPLHNETYRRIGRLEQALARMQRVANADADPAELEDAIRDSEMALEHLREVVPGAPAGDLETSE